MTHITNRSREGGGRSRASLALTLAASMLLGGALAANASSDLNLPSATGAPSEGTINIYKYKKTDAGASADGSQLATPPTNDYLDGVKFNYTQLLGPSGESGLYDLTTDAGWQAVSQITFDPATFDPEDYEQGVSGTTGATSGGSVTQTLPLGLYYITEVPGTALVNGTGDPVSVVPIVPFLVTLPLSVDDPGTPANPVSACIDTGGSGPLWSSDGTYTFDTSVDNQTDCEALYFDWYDAYEPLSTPATPGSGATSWSYDVYLYPKNSVPDVTKTITPGTDGGLTAGGRIEYNITAGLPIVDGDTLNADGTTTSHFLSNVVFTDVLDARLTYQDTPAPVVTVDGAAVTLTAGDPEAEPAIPADYEVTTAPAGNGGTLVVSLTEAGLAKLTPFAKAQAADGDVKVTMTFSAFANAESDPTEPITNGGPDNTDDEGNATNVVIGVDGNDSPPVVPPEIGDETQYGGISLWKYAFETATDTDDPAGEQDGATPLGGAEFMVFVSEAQALAYAAGTAVPGACFFGSPGEDATSTYSNEVDCVAGDGTLHGTWTTGPVSFYTKEGPIAANGYAGESTTDVAVSAAGTGEAIIGGLRYGTYWVLETKAPEGYSLLTAPFSIDIEMALDGEAFGTTGVSDDLSVPNVKQNAGFPIPSTGGSGVLVFTLLAVLIAGVTIVVLRKQKHSVA